MSAFTVGADGLRKAQVRLGARTIEVSELPFKQVKRIIPLLAGIMPKLAASDYSEELLDAMLSTVILAAWPATIDRAELENSVIPLDDLGEACGTIALLQKKQGAAPEGAASQGADPKDAP